MSPAMRRRPGRAIAAAPGGFLHLSLLASLRRRPSLQAHAQLLLLGLPLPPAAASRLLRPHLRAGHPLASLRLFLRLLRDHQPSQTSTAASQDEEAVPNSHTLSAALAACSRHASPSAGFSIHAFLLKSGHASEIFVANSLLHFYASFGLHSLACKLFDEMLARDTVSFNTLIGSYVQSGCIEGALGAFRNMVDGRFRVDGWTVTALLGAGTSLGDLRMAKAVHAVATRMLKLDFFHSGEVLIGLVDMYVKCGAVQLARRVFDLSWEKARNVRVWSVLVSGYARAGEIDMARRLFDEMPDKDLVAWTVLIGEYVQAGRYSEALRLFEEMETAGHEADEVTVVTVLSACVHHGEIELAKRLHGRVERNGLISRNARLATSFVHMYTKHGCIQTAMDVFHGVGDEFKTVELFNATISGLARHGFSEKAISLFYEMASLGLHPDEITFVGVLCACNHGGLIQQGFQMFNSMVDKYGVKPDIKHYACMADLLGRVGRLDDAYDFIQKMPYRANFVIWSSLLRSCRFHRNDKIGKLAEKHLGELDITYKPEKLTLSDLFSDEKRKEPVARVRKAMKHKSERRQTQRAEKQPLEFDQTCKPERHTLSSSLSYEKKREPAARARKAIDHKSGHMPTQLAEKQRPEFDPTCNSEKLTLSALFSDETRKEPARRARKDMKRKSKHRHTQLADKKHLEFRKPEKLALSDLFSDKKRKEQPASMRKAR